MEQLQDNRGGSQYASALNSLRVAKNWLWWLLFLAVVINLACFIAVRHADALEGSVSFRAELEGIRPSFVEPLPDPAIAPEPAAVSEAPAEVPAETAEAAPAETPEDPIVQASAEAPAEAPADEPADSQAAENFYHYLGKLLPTARSLGLICSTLLFLVLLLSVKVVLVGHLEGIGRLTSAMLWSLLLMVFFVPWRTAFPGIVLPSILFDRTELIEGTASVTWGAANVTWADHLLYGARFIGYPLLAILIWLNVQVKYALAFRKPKAAPLPQDDMTGIE